MYTGAFSDGCSAGPNSTTLSVTKLLKLPDCDSDCAGCWRNDAYDSLQMYLMAEPLEVSGLKAYCTSRGAICHGVNLLPSLMLERVQQIVSAEPELRKIMVQEIAFWWKKIRIDGYPDVQKVVDLWFMRDRELQFEVMDEQASSY